MLKLQPTFSDSQRQEIEQHLEQVRARRMQASIEYHGQQNLRLQRESEVIQRRIAQQYEMLGRELIRMEELDDKIQARLNKLTIMLQEVQTIDDLVNT